MPSNDKSVPRILQQQPERDSDPRQQQSGSSEFQPKPDAPTSQQEARDREAAEKEGRSHSKSRH
jgi:hypothetical protein